MSIKEIVRTILGRFFGKKRGKNIYVFLKGLYETILLAPERLYYNYIIKPRIINNIRRKDTIRVLFVIHELGSWKTERLYNSMKQHPRFTPLLLSVPSNDNDLEQKRVVAYFENKGYEYQMSNDSYSIRDHLKPDIIFYQKPYKGTIDDRFFFRNNLSSLFCYVYYSFRNKTLKESQNALIHKYIWQEYVENSSVQEELKGIMDNHAVNTVVTGLPVMDELMEDRAHYDDPWKPMPQRKRVIYAPHHSVVSDLGLWSTFLVYGEFILELAEKYKDKVQWAFKPHPLLEPKLNEIWGEEKTTIYYSRWRNLENGQVEMGPYMSLFKYSDAMIHDCGSFMLEYMYTLKPVLYLVKDEHHNDSINQQTLKAYNLHYLAKSKFEIEEFVINVINEKDPLLLERQKFYNEYLIPPYGKRACVNIINSILGECEYARN